MPPMTGLMSSGADDIAQLRGQGGGNPFNGVPLGLPTETGVRRPAWSQQLPRPANAGSPHRHIRVNATNRSPAGFLAHERDTAGTNQVAFMYEIARAEMAKGKRWGTGTALVCEMINDCKGWATEYHLITRDVAPDRHSTGDSPGNRWAADLYSKFVFKRTTDESRMTKNKPGWMESYWIASAVDAERGAREHAPHASEGWDFGKLEVLYKTPAAEAVKKIYIRTHKSDYGGDGRSWTEYDQRTRHILAYKGKPREPPPASATLPAGRGTDGVDGAVASEECGTGPPNNSANPCPRGAAENAGPSAAPIDGSGHTEGEMEEMEEWDEEREAAMDAHWRVQHGAQQEVTCGGTEGSDRGGRQHHQGSMR